MQERLLRLKQIIGDKKNGVDSIIPVSKSTWWDGVASGRYPKPRKLSEKVTVWRESEIMAVVDGTWRAAQ